MLSTTRYDILFVISLVLTVLTRTSLLYCYDQLGYWAHLYCRSSFSSLLERSNAIWIGWFRSQLLLVSSLPLEDKPIDYRWVDKTKWNSDGTLECYKAHLVAKDYTQLDGIDYHDFFPTAKMIINHCLLALVVAQNWSLYQLDVCNAFLHIDLHEEIYVSTTQFSMTRGEHSVSPQQTVILKVCLLLLVC